MELAIVGSPETFHVGRQLGQALLGLSQKLSSFTNEPPVIELVDHKPVVPDADCGWKIEDYTGSNPNGAIIISGLCPRCHQGTQRPNPESAKTGWFHCGQLFEVPSDMLREFTQRWNKVNNDPGRAAAQRALGQTPRAPRMAGW